MQGRACFFDIEFTTGSREDILSMMLGAARAAHVLTPSATVRRIVNMTALAVVDAGSEQGQG